MSYKLKKNISNLINHPFLTASLIYKILKNYFFLDYIEKKAKFFFIKNDFIKYFKTNDSNEFSPRWTDLKFMYDLIRKRKPTCVVEFGSGASTIAIGLGLRENELKDKIIGRLFSVDGNKQWIENTKKKLIKT